MKVFGLATGLAVVGFGVSVWCLSSRSRVRPDDEPEASPRTSRAIVDAKKSSGSASGEFKPGAKAAGGNRSQPVTEDDFPELSAKDRETAVVLQLALDDCDLERVRKAAKQASMSSDPEMRKRALDALDWFGEKTLPEMAMFIADPDEEVSSMALDACARALDEIEDQTVRFETSASYMDLLSLNGDVQDSFSTILSASASSLCTPEDDEDPAEVKRAAKNREVVVETFAKMIEKGGKLSETVKESYSFVTGHDWTGVDEARRWSQDPDNYEPPTSDHESGGGESQTGGVL